MHILVHIQGFIQDFFWGGSNCTSVRKHAPTRINVRTTWGGGGVWGHAPQENFDFYIILDCNPGENFYLDDTYQMTKHCTKFQEFWGGGNCGWGGGGGGDIPGPPPLYETLIYVHVHCTCNLMYV